MALGSVIVYVLIGIVIGFILARLTGGGQAEMKDELEKAKVELDQHRQELVDHFSNNAELLENIYRDYNKLCQNMAKTTTKFFPDQSELQNPFANRLAHTAETKAEESSADSSQEQPKDYSGTSSGLLKPNEEINHPEEKKKEDKKEVVEKVE